jgi:hypothetical protein
LDLTVVQKLYHKAFVARAIVLTSFPPPHYSWPGTLGLVPLSSIIFSNPIFVTSIL